eukprot:m.295706 g.295706  ORF g.295706 m.295706 type:complete len:88 (-) comp27181_c2_seq6:301-564(-)
MDRTAFSLDTFVAAGSHRSVLLPKEGRALVPHAREEAVVAVMEDEQMVGQAWANGSHPIKCSVTQSSDTADSLGPYQHKSVSLAVCS